MESQPFASKHNGGPPLENKRVQARDSDQRVTEDAGQRIRFLFCCRPLTELKRRSGAFVKYATHPA